ncbi:MAG: LytTR family transcriptional regulator [Rikenellaceae bacterium]|nr:LytTR family transcriptional regulator [Rikenellaceae bacterium]
MRILWTILYWGICLVVLATILSSLGYDFSASMFVGSMFLPGLLAIKFFVPQISFSSRWQGMMNAGFLAAAVLVLTYLLLFGVNNYIGVGVYHKMTFPPLLLNPIFILFVLVALALPEWLLDNFLKRREAERPQVVEFISDRRHISLPSEEIFYIESLDDEVVVHTIAGESLRTRTPISRWEATLNELHFVRIHRSYIVRRELIIRASRTEVELDGVTLPVSRKYAERVVEQ